MMAKFELQDNIQSVFKKKRNVPFASLEQINEELDKPVAYASRALLPVGKNYSQIEKEDLGIIFTVAKFHRFIHGRPQAITHYF